MFRVIISSSKKYETLEMVLNSQSYAIETAKSIMLDRNCKAPLTVEKGTHTVWLSAINNEGNYLYASITEETH